MTFPILNFYKDASDFGCPSINKDAENQSVRGFEQALAAKISEKVYENIPVRLESKTYWYEGQPCDTYRYCCSEAPDAELFRFNGATYVAVKIEHSFKANNADSPANYGNHIEEGFAVYKVDTFTNGEGNGDCIISPIASSDIDKEFNTRGRPNLADGVSNWNYLIGELNKKFDITEEEQEGWHVGQPSRMTRKACEEAKAEEAKAKQERIKSQTKPAGQGGE
jgi:hypothetical protein